MNESRYAHTIADSNRDTKKLELTGTPAFFVISQNNEITKISGAQPYSQFEKIFDSLLED